jgi:two-component system nitrogen regulation response regulator NtrX
MEMGCLALDKIVTPPDWHGFCRHKRAFCLRFRSELKKYKPMSEHILVVDDEAPTRELLSIYLKRRGSTVTTASTAADALRIVGELPVNLVILDINLGEKTSGLDLLEPIRKNHPNLPIILFSGIGLDEKTLQDARRKGVVGYLNKTQPLDQMWAEVQRALHA